MYMHYEYNQKIKLYSKLYTKNCAKFYGIIGIRDYHKGIVDATVLAIIVCKMAKKQ